MVRAYSAPGASSARSGEAAPFPVDAVNVRVVPATVSDVAWEQELQAKVLVPRVLGKSDELSRNLRILVAEKPLVR